VAGLARRPKGRQSCQRNPPVHRLLYRPAARYGKRPEAFLPPGSKRSRTIRQRERENYGMGLESVDEMGGLVARAARRFSLLMGRKQNHGLSIS